MRELVNKYGWIVVAVCVVTALAVWFFTRSGTRTGNPTLAFYVDDVTGAESVQPGTSIPPLLNKDGKPTLVQEVKISCNGGSKPYVAYLVKYSDDAKEKKKELDQSKDDSRLGELQDAIAKGMFVRRPGAGNPWVASNTDEGQQIMSVHCDNGQPAIVVWPR